MHQFDTTPGKQEHGPKKILAIEPNAEVASMYTNWFKQKMNVSVETVPAGNALIEKRADVDMIIVEPPTNENIGNYILKLRDLYPKEPIVVASQRDDILSEIKDREKFPNVSAITKPFFMEELGELVDVIKTDDWKKPITKRLTEN